MAASSQKICNIQFELSITIKDSFKHSFWLLGFVKEQKNLTDQVQCRIHLQACCKPSVAFILGISL